MPSYVISGTVTLSDVVVPSVNVLVRNDRTNEYASVTTNTAGKFLYDLNNLSSEWAIGDIITCVCTYTTYEDSVSYIILTGEGGHIFSLVLEAIVIGNLNYCSIQEVFDYLGTTSSSTLFTTEQVRSIGIRMEDQIERRCNTVFHSNSGSYTTITTEYHDVRNVAQRYFFLRKRPVIAFTKIEVNTADDSNATGNWVDVTTDCKTDSETGRVDLVGVNNAPTTGTNMFRATYTYGFATTPEEIRELTVLMICRSLMRSNLCRAVIEGKSEFTAPQADLLNDQIEKIFSRWTYTADTNV